MRLAVVDSVVLRLTRIGFFSRASISVHPRFFSIFQLAVFGTSCAVFHNRSSPCKRICCSTRMALATERQLLLKSPEVFHALGRGEADVAGTIVPSRHLLPNGTGERNPITDATEAYICIYMYVCDCFLID